MSHTYGTRLLRVIRATTIALGIAPHLGHCSAQQKQASATQLGLAGGTVNVMIAQDGELVAVTDSMLTFESGAHQPIGVKLYQIDEKTICSMAGLYQNSFSPTSKMEPHLSAWLPEIMSEVIDELKDAEGRSGQRDRASSIPFENKVLSIMDSAKFEFSAHFQALETTSERREAAAIMPLELTIAGFDRDGSLKVAEVTLKAEQHTDGISFISIRRPRGPNPPSCEMSGQSMPLAIDYDREEAQNTPVRTVGSELFCEVAGLPETAERLLNDPLATPSAALKIYAQAMNTHTRMTIDQMRALAIDLEQRTADDEHASRKLRVGGDQQIAVLDAGFAKIEKPLPPSVRPAPDIGADLSIPRFSFGTIDCHGRRLIALGHTATDKSGEDATAMTVMTGRKANVAGTLIDCKQELDGIILHDAQLINSQLSYAGREELRISDDTVVTGSTLSIGPGVDDRQNSVNHLLCHFAWKSITKDGRALKVDCGEDQKPHPPNARSH